LPLTEPSDRPPNSAVMLFKSVLAAIHSLNRRTSSSCQVTPLPVRRADNEKKRQYSSRTIDLNRVGGMLVIFRMLVSPNMIEVFLRRERAEISSENINGRGAMRRESSPINDASKVAVLFQLYAQYVSMHVAAR